MKPSRRVKRGNEFLVGVDLSWLEQKLKKTPAGKQRELLHAAILCKKGRDEDTISMTLRRSKSTVSRWLNKLEKGGGQTLMPYVTARAQAGLQSSQMSSKRWWRRTSQRIRLRACLSAQWTARLLAAHICRKFGVSYYGSGALALAKRMEFSVRAPRPVPHNTPDRGNRRVCQRHDQRDQVARGRRLFGILPGRGRVCRLAVFCARAQARGRTRDCRDQL